jgi:cation diffusion facilitator family transporter
MTAMAVHRHDLSAFAHTHSFSDGGTRQREHALVWVTAITLLTMVGELLVGWWSGSLALTADGWHMGTHALAFGGAVLAYRLSARASTRTGFAFGGWKIEVLSAYTSGLLLLVVALWLVVDSAITLFIPRSIAYAEAMIVAAGGLVVNVLCAWLMTRGERARNEPSHEAAHAHAHTHEHGHGQGAHAGHHDHNFQAAYLHIVADAFTSVLAIVALGGGLWFGWRWLDPAVALVGAVVIGRWAITVLRSSSRALVDATEDPALAQRIRSLIEADGDAKLADLHVWQVGASSWSAIVSIVADRPLSATDYRARLASLHELRHLTLEVHHCKGGL